MQFAWATQPGIWGTLSPHYWDPGVQGGTMKMIFLEINLCFYSRQSFEVFLLCSVQVTEFQLPWL